MFYFYAWGLNWCIVINIGLTVNQDSEEYTGLFHAHTSSLYYQEDNVIKFIHILSVSTSITSSISCDKIEL